jgi:Xaa-Pro aminopeptidase
MKTRIPGGPRRTVSVARAGGRMSAPQPISHAEYAARRRALLRALDGRVGLLLAGEAVPSLSGRWQADKLFAYFTGLTGEPGAAVLLDPTAEDPRRRCTLFLRPLNPEADRWDGYRDPISAGLRERLGFETVLRTTALPAALTGAARRSRALVCLHPFTPYTAAAPSPDLAIFRKVQERVPGVSIVDGTLIPARMRAVKSPAELALIRRAIEITAMGFRAAMRTLAPGIGERAVQVAVEDVYRRQGACGPDGSETAYATIVGAGLNAAVLHYQANSGPTRAGDLVVIDSGAQVHGYAADITRTLPVSGRFTREQRELYELVLRAQDAAIRAVRPGAMLFDVHEAARRIFQRAGLADAFIHGIGHHLGLDVHDPDPGTARLAPGHVVTIEPGIYLPERSIGIRIEDDILVTRRGSEILSAGLARSVEEIEAAMRPGTERAGARDGDTPAATRRHRAGRSARP